MPTHTALQIPLTAAVCVLLQVRTKLFRIMMRQDIAFFDGMRTGDLQSRLSEDISVMVQPIYTTLSTMLSNLTLLIGGVTMCFITSWRLSMLAFTTILPMMHITGVYAEWSRKINKQIYQHLSDAMSRMGEAVSNIRTVRATSSEEIEAKMNDKTLFLALRAGIKDAIAGGIAAALNDYLDLLAGVLILWYGGTIAMDPGGSITVGQLITYQVRHTPPPHSPFLSRPFLASSLPLTPLPPFPRHESSFTGTSSTPQYKL